MNVFDSRAMQALSDAGAQCGVCGDQPGDRICPDCERCYRDYVAALRKAGWAPRTEVLGEAADVAEGLRQFERAIGARKSAQVSENVGIFRVADKLRHMAAEPDNETAPRTERSHWQAIADALNAAEAAGLGVGVDLDGTLTDHNAWSVVWDRDLKQWAVAGYDSDEPADEDEGAVA